MTGEPNIYVKVLFENEIESFYTTVNVIRLLSTLLTLPSLLVGFHFFKVIVESKQSYRHDFFRLLKRMGVSSLNIRLILTIEEIALGVLSGVIAIPLGLIIATINLSAIYPGEMIELSLTFSYVIWSIIIGMAITISSNLTSYRNLSGISLLKRMDNEETIRVTNKDDLDRLDKLLLVTGSLPIILLSIKLSGFDIALLDFRIGIFDLLFRIVGTPLLIISPFLLSYSFINLLLYRTNVFELISSRITRVIAPVLEFAIKASMINNKSRNLKILFILCFTTSIVIFPISIFETCKNSVVFTSQQDIGADVSINFPHYPLNQSIEDQLLDYDFIESRTSIVKIKWRTFTRPSVLYEIYAIDPSTYLSTVNQKSIIQNGVSTDTIIGIEGNKVLYQENMLKSINAPSGENITYNMQGLRDQSIDIPDLSFVNSGTFRSLPGIVPNVEELRGGHSSIWEASVVFIVCNQDNLLSLINENELDSYIFSYTILIELKESYKDPNSSEEVLVTLEQDFEYCNVRSAVLTESNYLDQLSYLFKGINTILSLDIAFLAIITTLGAIIIYLQFYWNQAGIYRLYSTRGISTSSLFRGVFCEFWSQSIMALCVGFIFGIVIGIAFTFSILEIAELSNPFLYMVAFPITLVTIEQILYLVSGITLITFITLSLAYVNIYCRNSVLFSKLLYNIE